MLYWRRMSTWAILKSWVKFRAKVQVFQEDFSRIFICPTWRHRKWNSTSVFLAEESYGQGSLAGYSPWGSQRIRHNWVTEHKKNHRSNIPKHVWARMLAKLLQLCLTLFDAMDCSLSDFSVHGIPQPRILKWGAISYSRGIFLTLWSNLHLLHWQADSLILPPEKHNISIRKTGEKKTFQAFIRASLCSLLPMPRKGLLSGRISLLNTGNHCIKSITK